MKIICKQHGLRDMVIVSPDFLDESGTIIEGKEFVVVKYMLEECVVYLCVLSREYAWKWGILSDEVRPAEEIDPPWDHETKGVCYGCFSLKYSLLA